MSLKTRCPACDTVFKIVPDQLKVSSGWVRCGRCAEVFDAASHAVASDAPTVLPQTNEAAIAAFLASSPLDQATSAARVNNYEATESIAIEAINKPSDLNHTDLSFVRIAQGKAFWQRLSVVRNLLAACIGLLGLLFFQVTFSQRNHLAAYNPAFKTGFESLCRTLGCNIESFKNIEAFKIDSSSFQKSQSAASDATKAEVFALKLAIKNTAELEVAIPAVELTLTDANDKAVLRRVLLTKDLGLNTETLAANGEWSGSMAVTVTPSMTSSNVTGYRVLLFYP